MGDASTPGVPKKVPAPADHADKHFIAFLYNGMIRVVMEATAHKAEVHPHVLEEMDIFMTQLKGEMLEWAETEDPWMYRAARHLLGTMEDYFPEEWVGEVETDDEEEPDA